MNEWRSARLGSFSADEKAKEPNRGLGFGSADRNNPLAPGEFQHAGLNGEWVLEQYADRLSVALVRYSGGQATVEDRFYVKLQMGEPDLVIEEPNSPSVFTVGNLGSGTHQNYTEVDIFSAADRSTAVR